MSYEIAQCLELKIALQRLNRKRSTSYNYFKPLQSKCIQLIYKNDVIAALKTGYGKSLIFETLAYYKTQTFQSAPVILIISPLNAIIKEQLDRYGDEAVHVNPEFINALHSHDCSVAISCAHKCKYSNFKGAGFRFILGHPEHFMDRVLFELFKCDVWQNNVKYIVVDEAHCIDKWGEAFRKEFGRLSRLRSIFPKARVLALTGTATEKTISEIKSSLNLISPSIVKTTVVRNNIKINVSKKPADIGTDIVYEKVMSPYLSDFKEQLDAYPKTIVFSKLQFCGLGYSLVERDGSHKLVDGTRIAAQYHSPCTEQMKQDVQKGMKQSNIRLLFATEAYSMGTDSPDIKQIIHFGVPYSLESYLQEIGRAGRDGNPASAVLFFNNNDIAKNRPCDEAMRNFINTDGCRWQFISHFFDENDKCELSKDHSCCDNCAKNCTCYLCKEVQDNFDSQIRLDISSSSNKLSKVKKNILQSLLQTYFNAENDAADIPNPEIFTGLDMALMKAICANASKLLERKSFAELFPCLKDLYVDNIITIIDHVVKSDL